mmetsp:Transcript_29447/g.99194  ORF Transcript_29447/g.99194 Transcript_29447/m.99194 type:complete len:158 (-) Transcript_29447:3-476(-)
MLTRGPLRPIKTPAKAPLTMAGSQGGQDQSVDSTEEFWREPAAAAADDAGDELDDEKGPEKGPREAREDSSSLRLHTQRQLLRPRRALTTARRLPVVELAAEESDDDVGVFACSAAAPACAFDFWSASLCGNCGDVEDDYRPRDEDDHRPLEYESTE